MIRNAEDFDPKILAADRARALKLVDVSRETSARLDRFVALLFRWQKTMNIVAPSTLPHVWTRHIADSLQLRALAPDARTWLDIGSGGGFPGLILACELLDQREFGGTQSVILVESNGKKAAFLREAVRVTESPAIVVADRIENVVDRFRGRVDVVTARAFAPLERLVALSFPLLEAGARGLFPKGQDVEAELTEAAKYWKLTANFVPSRTDPKGVIVDIRNAARGAARP